MANRNYLQKTNTMKNIGSGLEKSVNEIKRINREVARTLSYNQNPWINKVPIVRNIINKVVATKPFPALEMEIRRGVNRTLISLDELGRKIYGEKERIKEMKGVYNKAVKENWGSDKFLKFIEQGTGISFKTHSDEGGGKDLKEVFKEMYSNLPSSKQKEKQQEYLKWLKQHIDLSEQYVVTMNILCAVACGWVEGMGRKYYDIAKFRGGMEEMERAIQNISKGGNAAVITDNTIKIYAISCVKAAGVLNKGLKEMNKSDNDPSEFRKVVEDVVLEIEGTSNKYKSLPGKVTSKKVTPKNNISGDDISQKLYD